MLKDSKPMSRLLAFQRRQSNPQTYGLFNDSKTISRLGQAYGLCIDSTVIRIIMAFLRTQSQPARVWPFQNNQPTMAVAKIPQRFADVLPLQGLQNNQRAFGLGQNSKTISRLMAVAMAPKQSADVWPLQDSRTKSADLRPFQVVNIISRLMAFSKTRKGADMWPFQ